MASLVLLASLNHLQFFVYAVLVELQEYADYLRLYHRAS